jgi:T4-like virus Myoviridae tail sheath stabiliser
MQYFYDGQLRRYITQFIRLMSNFSYKDATGKITQVPVRYGDLNRQAGNILRKNSENTVPSAPLIACYIKDMKYDRTRLQDPTYVSAINLQQRALDDNGNLLNTQGNNYTVERIMPSPYKVTFAADIWTSNTDQKFQIIEQVAMVFNPSLNLQTTDNYVDWTSLITLTLTDQGTWSSRQIPQGLEQDIDISSLVFESPIWISPPANVTQLNIVTKIISNVFDDTQGLVAGLEAGYGAQIFGTPDVSVVVTPTDFNLLLLDGVATLQSRTFSNLDINANQPPISWNAVLGLYPGKFTAGLSQLRLKKPNGLEIVAFMTLSTTDETKMLLNFDAATIPENTIIGGRGSVDAVINPDTFNPTVKTAGTRYLILEDIHSEPVIGPAAWLNSDGSGFAAKANDIIQWNGSSWSVVFNSAATATVTYITNAYTGIQYMWNGAEWGKSYDGIYDKASWRLIL